MTYEIWRKSSFSGSQGDCVEVSDPRWRKSSHSGTQGDCVEVSETPDDEIAVRNSNRPDDGTLLFTRSELAAFIAGCKAGEFDDISA